MKTRVWPHLLLAVGVLAFTAQGLGYRALWQDEIETAERARTVLESGVPRIIDRSGELSVNWGGHELDQGAVHRYNTWGQFYFAAAGLGLGRLIGMNPDAAVRGPFVAAHAASAGLVSFGLSAFARAPLPVSLLAGAVVAVQTPRLVHNRTARYHALLDLLAVIGLVAVGAWRYGSRGAPPVFGLVLIALPHTHVFGGIVLDLALSVLALYVSVSAPGLSGRARVREVTAYIVVPGLVSLGLLLALTRPWRSGAMGGTLAIDLSQLLTLHTLANVRHLGYAGAAVALGLAVLLYQRRWGAALALAAATLAVVLSVRIFDFNELTQSWAMRYYLAVPLLGLFWAIALGLEELPALARAAVIGVICLVALAPELVPSRSGQAGFAPLWGVRLVLSDRAHAAAGDRQPLHRAVAMIRERAGPADPVAIDYVPQFVPWYLAGHPTALVPDPVGRHEANRDNPVWARPVQFPRWHLRYTQWPNGTWFCAPRCDYFWSGDLTQGQYQLTSKTLGRTARFCIHGVWLTNPWNNSPPLNYNAAALTPEGVVDGALVLGGPCPGARDSQAPVFSSSG